jgi:putative transposase
MRRMGMETVYRRPNISKPAPGHRIYPYLLRGLAIDWPNQVWAMDITYVPMARGFIYLISSPSWTGSAAGFYRGACRSRWGGGILH